MICEIKDVKGKIYTLDFDNLESTFINCDCMEALKRMPDKCIDWCISDPPYGIGVGSMAYTNGVQIVGNALAKRTDYSGHKEWDSKPPSEEYFKELFRVSKNQIIWGGELLYTVFRAYKELDCMG